MKYCMECGTKLTEKYLENEGVVPYCSTCKDYRFPIYSVAVSMIVRNKSDDKILLIKQYGGSSYILVAGYVNKGEAAEAAVIREMREETGIDVFATQFNKSEYFETTNTLMLNFTCMVETESLDNLNTSEVHYTRCFTFAEAVNNIKSKSLAEKFLLNYLNNRM